MHKRLVTDNPSIDTLGTRWKRLMNNEATLGMAFSTPALLVFTAVVLLPFIVAIGMAFCDYHALYGFGGFVGLKNFSYIFTAYEAFTVALTNTLVWAVVSVTLKLITGFAIALMLSRPFRGCSFYRVCIFLPWVVPGSVTALTWNLFYNTNFGPLHALLRALHLVGSDNLLAAEATSLWAVMLVYFWGGLSFSVMMLLAGLQSIPDELYEAASIDGANYVQTLGYVTIPCMKTIVFIVTALQVINAFKNFELVYLMTKGGPIYSSLVLSVICQRTAFEYYRLSTGAAIGVVMMLILIIPIFVYMKHVLAEE